MHLRTFAPLPLCLLAVSSLAQKPAPALHASNIDLGDAVYESLLLHGFSKPQGGWRWTSRTFAVSLTRPGGREAVYLVLDFGLPIELAQTNAGISVAAKVNGTSLPSQRFVNAGRYQYVATVPESALRTGPAKVEFELDRTFRAADGSERGLTALSVSLQHTNTAAFDRQAETARAREGFEYLLKKRALLIPDEKQTDMVRLFHQVPVWGHMFFQNIQIEKNPLDLWMMQQVIYEVQPDFVIETGTWKGGSALYFAHTLNGMALERSKVITVDIQDAHQIASAHPLWRKYVTAFTGSSTDPDIVGKIAQLAKGKKTVIALDSDHSMAHVLKELNLYAPLVSAGSYLVVEDTHIDGVPTDPNFGPGPMAAVRRFLEEGGDKIFEQDVTREAYIMTFNPGGWLRKK